VLDRLVFVKAGRSIKAASAIRFMCIAKNDTYLGARPDRSHPVLCSLMSKPALFAPFDESNLKKAAFVSSQAVFRPLQSFSPHKSRESNNSKSLSLAAFSKGGGLDLRESTIT
jgi:hypothetical protein